MKLLKIKIFQSATFHQKWSNNLSNYNLSRRKKKDQGIFSSFSPFLCNLSTESKTRINCSPSKHKIFLIQLSDWFKYSSPLRPFQSELQLTFPYRSTVINPPIFFSSLLSAQKNFPKRMDDKGGRKKLREENKNKNRREGFAREENSKLIIFSRPRQQSNIWTVRAVHGPA